MNIATIFQKFLLLNQVCYLARRISIFPYFQLIFARVHILEARKKKESGTRV